MKKGQGSLEYLLILAAILAIAVVVVVVANSMISAPSEQATLNQDKYNCGVQGIELTDYSKVGGSFGVSYGGAGDCSSSGYNLDYHAADCTLNNDTVVDVSYNTGGCNFTTTP